MGMFDNIECQYPLPIPDDPIELRGFPFNSRVYQTKSFDTVMDTYIIKADGTLWHEEYDIEDKSDPNATGFARCYGIMTRTNKREKQLSDYTGVVNFYEYISDFAGTTLNNDYWIEYNATFVNGLIQKIELFKFKATDNRPRRARDARFKLQEQARKALWSKWYMKYGYRYYDNFIGYMFRLWNKITRKIPSHKLERFLRPL